MVLYWAHTDAEFGPIPRDHRIYFGIWVLGPSGKLSHRSSAYLRVSGPKFMARVGCR